MVSNVPPPSVLYVCLVLHRFCTIEDERWRKEAVLGRLKALVNPLCGPFRPAVFLLVKATVSCVENPGALSHQHLEGLRYAGSREVLQSPVPVVVVIGAEFVVAAHQFVVHLPGDGHAYVVFGGHPPSGQHLIGQFGKISQAIVVPQSQHVTIWAAALPELYH